ncbi:Hsp70 family protein, partial [Nocardia sp. NPDC001010]
MTERLALGITVGAANSVAAATTADGSGTTVRAHHSALLLGADGSTGFADAAQHARGVVVDDYLSRVGDPVDLLAEDGSSHDAADLVAAATHALVTELAGRASAEATIVACYPAWWSEPTVETTRAALTRAGLPEVTLVPEPMAAVRRYEMENGLLDDGALAVYDLGASGLTVTVLRTGDQAGMLGAPLHSTAIAGTEFDLLTMRYVLANALDGQDIDPFDPVVEAELSALRARCRNAKEELSRITATVIPVGLLGAAHTAQVRLTRGELEDLLRPTLFDSMNLLHDAVRRAGLTMGDISRVLLTGGGGAIPLVAELISTEFGLPVAACADPASCTAHGAAEIALDVAAVSVPTEAIPAAVVALPAVAAPVVDDIALPADEPAPTKMFTAKRAAIIAAAAVTMAALATGTLALGGVTTPSTPSGPVATTSGAPVPGATAATSTGGAPGAVDGTDSTVADPTRPGAPSTATPPGQTQAGTTQPGTPG